MCQAYTWSIKHAEAAAGLRQSSQVHLVRLLRPEHLLHGPDRARRYGLRRWQRRDAERYVPPRGLLRHCPPRDVRGLQGAEPATDGTFILNVAGHQVGIYCHQMSSNPAEYLTLAQTGDSLNFSRYAPNQTTWYTKVRFHTDTLKVDVADAT